MTGITLLAAQAGKTTAKTITREGSEDFDAGWLFHHKWLELDGLDKLEKVLRHFSDPEKRMLAIRGKVRDGAPDRIRRSKKDATEKYGPEHGPAWVDDVDQRWLTVDFDGIDIG